MKGRERGGETQPVPALYDGGLTEVEGELHGAARQLLLEVQVRLRERWAQRASQIPDVLFRMSLQL